MSLDPEEWERLHNHEEQSGNERNDMERNPALAILRTLRHSKAPSMTDAELRKAAGLTQAEIDLAAEELEEQGMILVERTYALPE